MRTVEPTWNDRSVEVPPIFLARERARALRMKAETPRPSTPDHAIRQASGDLQIQGADLALAKVSRT